jgi:hypothetical protein
MATITRNGATFRVDLDTPGQNGGTQTSATYSLIGCTVSVEVLHAVSDPAIGTALFEFQKANASETLEIALAGTNGYARRFVGGTPFEEAMFFYDDSAPIYLRFREMGGAVYFETSIDESTWTTQLSVGGLNWLGAGIINIGGNMYGQSNGEHVELDNLNL